MVIQQVGPVSAGHVARRALEEVDLPDGRPRPVPTADRRRAGRSLRQPVPRSAHAEFHPAADRPDPVSILEAQHVARVPELVPIRCGRMLHSPFTFFRGAAAVMAYDLSGTPSTGIDVQVCGDAHLLNFGLYATPERRLVFGANDFDETLRGPWEWDLKRLAASMAVAARTHGMTEDQARCAAQASGTAYRERLSEYASQRSLEVWYATVDAGMVEQLLAAQKRRQAKSFGPHGPALASMARGQDLDAVRRATSKAMLHDSIHAAVKLTEVVDGRCMIRHQPPLINRMDGHPEVAEQLHAVVVAYFQSLSEERRYLVSRFCLSDLAMKVVGVGSVGTRCFIGLFHGDGEGEDPLFLQIKEAMPSVLEPFLEPSPYQNQGQRVVVGQRMMQAHPDIFLGWTHAPITHRDFYVRQLRDMKGSFDVERMTPDDLARYGALCGWALARSHARSGDAATISGYLGTKDVFDRALGEFAVTYADQNQRDYEALIEAVASGRVHADLGI